MLGGLFDGLITQLHNPTALRDGAAIFRSSVEAGLILAILACGAIIVICGAMKVWNKLAEERPTAMNASLAGGNA